MRKMVVSILLIVATSCQLVETKFPILDNPVCEPPCWQNIVPGETGEQELYELLSGLSFVDKHWTPYLNSQGAAFTGRVSRILYPSEQYRTSLDVFFLGDLKVAVISLGGTWHITLAETIEKLGKPQNVVLERYNGDIWGNFVDPARGIAFGYDTFWKPESWRTEMRPDIEVQWINYFNPDVYKALTETGIFSSFRLNPEEAANVTYPWDGYGNLDEKYPPR